MTEAERKIRDLENDVHAIESKQAALSPIPELFRDLKAQSSAIFRKIDDINNTVGDIRVCIAGKQDSKDCDNEHDKIFRQLKKNGNGTSSIPIIKSERKLYHTIIKSLVWIILAVLSGLGGWTFIGEVVAK